VACSASCSALLGAWMVTVHATDPPLFKQVQKREYKEIELERVTLRSLSLIYINWQPNVFPLLIYCDECNANNTQGFR